MAGITVEFFKDDTEKVKGMLSRSISKMVVKNHNIEFIDDLDIKDKSMIKRTTVSLSKAADITLDVICDLNDCKKATALRYILHKEVNK